MNFLPPLTISAPSQRSILNHFEFRDASFTQNLIISMAYSDLGYTGGGGGGQGHNYFSMKIAFMCIEWGIYGIGNHSIL